MYIIKSIYYLLIIYFIVNVCKIIFINIKSKRIENLRKSLEIELLDAKNKDNVLTDIQKRNFNKKLSNLVFETNKLFKLLK